MNCRCTAFAILLACSWTLAASGTSPVAPPKEMEFIDYLVDFDTLPAQGVQLRGVLLAMGDDVAILSERAGSMNSLFVDLARLSADEKKYLLARCGSGCAVTVVGTPEIVMFNKGLAVTKLISPQVAQSTPKTDQKGSKRTPMDVAGFITDYDLSFGREVEVRGTLLSMGEMWILYQSRGSMTFVFIEGSALSREDRKYVLSRCGAGCSLTLAGRPGDVMMSHGLIASRIVR